MDAYNVICEKYNLKKQEWININEVLIDDVILILDYLKNKYNLGIIANQPLGTTHRLDKLGIRDYFKVIMSSAEEKVKKPDKEIFLRALQQASINSEEAIMIGDRLDNDILPAMKLGFKTIWLKRSYGSFGNPNLLPKNPDFTITKLIDLLSIL